MHRYLGLIAVLLLAALLAATCKSPVENFHIIYIEGYKNYMEQNYADAIKLFSQLAFNRLINEYPGSDLYKPASLKLKELKNKSRRRMQ